MIHTINDNECWICGKKLFDREITRHHVIPITFKPKHNIIIPLCKKCHDELHSTNIQQIIRALGHIMKEHKGIVRKIDIVLQDLHQLDVEKIKNEVKKCERN